MVKAPNHIHPIISSTQSTQQSTQPDGLTTSGLLLLEAVIEGFIDGIMILSEQGEILHANAFAQQICRGLNPYTLSDSIRPDAASQTVHFHLPQKIWRMCQVVIEGCDLFPDHKIVSEEEVLLNDVPLRIRIQRLDPELSLIHGSVCSRPRLLVTLENRLQAIQRQVIADKRKYALTNRETEVWLLRLQGYSYRDIAAKLCISEHTVRKHTRGILAKRRIWHD